MGAQVWEGDLHLGYYTRLGTEGSSSQASVELDLSDGEPNAPSLWA